MLEPISAGLNNKQKISTIARCISLNLVAIVAYAAVVYLVSYGLLSLGAVLQNGLPANTTFAISLGFLYLLAVVVAYLFGVILASIGQPVKSQLARYKTNLFIKTSGIMWLPFAFSYLQNGFELLAFASIFGAYIAGQTRVLRKIEFELDDKYHQAILEAELPLSDEVLEDPS